MRRAIRRILLGCAVLAAIASLWALNVELTFERNLRRGVPADFRIHRSHRPPVWRI
jgi:hypothetical protein